MKKTSTLQNKIKAYSTIALSVVGVGALQSQIVYHDVIPDKVLTGHPETFNIDMDGNSVNDFQAQTILAAPGYQANLLNQIPANNAIAGSTILYTSFGYVQAFALNNPIGPSATWKTQNRMVLASSWYGAFYGNFGDNQPHYAGVRFKIGSNTHYGWIRFTGIPQTGMTMTIQDWAYNSVANTPINAGVTGVGINELPNNEAVKLYCYNKMLNINNLNNKEKGNIKISNLMGQELRNIAINDSKMVIDLNNLPLGIYLVTIQNGNNNFTRKINVK